MRPDRVQIEPAGRNGRKVLLGIEHVIEKFATSATISMTFASV
jgi:hypothetical protein